ncbi:MAG: hypothetical protein PHW10_04885 [Candidatus Peribacteraceae bacterium]|nr:hypothetical protein [Candidatus Peribacteraceae bacterium]
MRLSSFLPRAVLAAALVLSACAPRPPSDVPDRAAAEAYIRANISALSPESAVLGGTFYVTDIRWQDEDTAVVEYEDGHIALRGTTDVRVENGETVAGPITKAEENLPPSSSSSVAGRNPAQAGEFCGGIAGFQCADGLTCKYDGNYPDAGGTCVSE